MSSLCNSILYSEFFFVRNALKRCTFKVRVCEREGGEMGGGREGGEEGREIVALALLPSLPSSHTYTREVKKKKRKPYSAGAFRLLMYEA
jgi:hypothetical protein